jgi:hypothetical protein
MADLFQFSGAFLLLFITILIAEPGYHEFPLPSGLGNLFLFIIRLIRSIAASLSYGYSIFVKYKPCAGTENFISILLSIILLKSATVIFLNPH